MIPQSERAALLARDIMTPNPICVRETDLAKDIQDYFSKYQISSVPVLNQAGDLVGIISTADIARSKQILDMKEFIELVFHGSNVNIDQLQEFFHLDSFEEITVQDIMSTTPSIASEEMLIRDMARMMYENHTHRVIILNQEERVIGIVSSLDIIRACYPA